MPFFLFPRTQVSRLTLAAALVASALFTAVPLAASYGFGPPQQDTAAVNTATFKGEFGPLPAELIPRMKQFSWRTGCPVPLEDLAYMRLSHWGYDSQVHEGELVVNREVARDVLAIFAELFEKHFPIEKMRLIEEYEGSDDRSMSDNNTSAFNCRPVAGNPGVYSNHSFGLAIDVNPKINPYVTSKKVSPEEGQAYVDRTLKVPGLIVAGDACHSAFLRQGWTWGGAWKNVKDYQHFEKKTDANREIKKTN